MTRTAIAPVIEPVDAIRVVADPTALDAAHWHGHLVDVLRIAPDEALGLGATGVTIDGDPDAIVERDSGFAVAMLGPEDFSAIAAHTDWEISGDAGAMLQGKIAGVPAKLVVGDPGFLVTHVAYADELERRLGWR